MNANPSMPLDAPPDRIADATHALRRHLLPVLAQQAGDPPRPSRLMRNLGLDKSMASRLAQAIRAEDDAELLHRLPSPAALRSLLERAAGAGLPESQRQAAATAVEAFQKLIDATPGGRQALDARLGAQADGVRLRREHMARQAVFKAQSFLFGHYCDTLTTSLFLQASATPGQVDVLEVHRRLGLHPVRPGTVVPVLSVIPGGLQPPEAAHTPRMLTLAGHEASERIEDYLLPGFSSLPAPALRVAREGPTTLFLLDGEDRGGPPLRLSTALIVRHAAAAELPTPGPLVLRNYLLHLPCARLVRELYLAPGLWPGAQPQLRFLLPSPQGSPPAPAGPAPHRDIPLHAQWTPCPETAPALALPRVPDQAAALQAALAQAGWPTQGWRGWRCDMAYPLPLVDMQVGVVGQG